MTKTILKRSQIKLYPIFVKLDYQIPHLYVNNEKNIFSTQYSRQKTNIKSQKHAQLYRKVLYLKLSLHADIYEILQTMANLSTAWQKSHTLPSSLYKMCWNQHKSKFNKYIKRHPAWSTTCRHSSINSRQFD